MLETDEFNQQKMDHLDDFDFFSVSAPYRAKFPKRKFKGKYYYILFKYSHCVSFSWSLSNCGRSSSCVFRSNSSQLRKNALNLLNLHITEPFSILADNILAK